MTPQPAGDVPDVLFHIALTSDWAAAQEVGEYRVSTLGLALDQVGFIHASYPGQVPATAARFYADVAEPLVLLRIETARLGCEVRVEEAVPGGERFPHVYGPIPVAAVVSASPFARGPGQGFPRPER